MLPTGTSRMGSQSRGRRGIVRCQNNDRVLALGMLAEGATRRGTVRSGIRRGRRARLLGGATTEDRVGIERRAHLVVVVEIVVALRTLFALTRSAAWHGATVGGSAKTAWASAAKATAHRAIAL